MSKKTKIFLIILLIISLTIAGTSTFIVIKNLNNNHEVEEEPKKEDEVKEFSYIPIMYKVCDEDSCIHILGSMHMGGDKITNYDQKVLDIYEASDSIAVELGPEEEAKLNVEDFIYTDGTTITNHISKELNNKLIQFSKEHEDYMFSVYKYFNVGLNSMLLENIMNEEAKLTHEGADDYFIKKAQSDKKEIISIEKLEDQLKTITDYSDEFHSRQIEELIDNYDELLESSKEMYQIYLDGNEEKLSEYINGSYSSPETEEEKRYVYDLIISRNKKMTDAAEEFLKNNKNTLIIVGAAHLIYEDSGMIPSLKKNNNYKVTRVE